MSGVIWTKDNLDKVNTFLEVQSYIGGISEPSSFDAVLYDLKITRKFIVLFINTAAWCCLLYSFILLFIKTAAWCYLFDKI